MREFLINADVLESSIKALQPFCSKEETRYYLCGIFFEWNPADDFIHMVATDGHKLCQIKCDIDPAEDATGKISAIVPTQALKTALQMLKSMGNKEIPVTLRFSENNLNLHIDCYDQKADFKCIDGSYPDYRRVIPTEKPKFSIGLAKEQAAEALKAVKSHKSKEPLEWKMIDASSPLMLQGENKIVVVMPCRTAWAEAGLDIAA